jgi:hypothetical protein
MQIGQRAVAELNVDRYTLHVQAVCRRTIALLVPARVGLRASDSPK